MSPIASSTPAASAGWIRVLRRRFPAFESLWQEFPDNVFLIACDRDGEFLLADCNPAQQAFIGLPAAATQGKRVRDLVAEPYRETVLERYRQCVATGKPLIYEESGTVEGGGAVHYWMTLLVPAHGADGQVAFILGVSRDVTALRQAEEVLRRANEELEQRVAMRTAELEAANARLRQIAMYDALTGVFSRAHFFEQGRDAFRLSDERDEPLAVLMLDIDHFKRINDRWGHAAGDDVLRMIGAKLAALFGAGDLIGRCGGEEFAVILPGGSTGQACALANQVCEAIRSHAFIWQGVRIPCSVSVGAAARQPGDDTLEALLHRADLALLQVKAGGRDGYRLAAEPAPAAAASLPG
ncbi:diguanylate cyclase [Crenobacter caeni]|uniref:diguanylate cyclase n=1 Tax=Crenobacter caeni TaxID=2705474 RepID=A0A6B2KNZ8_9NEIS|nr:diguanylate cyclase [Crenobacter caeni]